MRDLKIESLETLARFHLTTADMYIDKGEVSMAKVFRKLSAEYQEAADRRKSMLLEMHATNGKEKTP